MGRILFLRLLLVGVWVVREVRLLLLVLLLLVVGGGLLLLEVLVVLVVLVLLEMEVQVQEEGRGRGSLLPLCIVRVGVLWVRRMVGRIVLPGDKVCRVVVVWEV